MPFKQKKRVKNTRNKYLKPGALAQLCYNKASSRSCTDIGKKRVSVATEKSREDALQEVESIGECTPMQSPKFAFRPFDGSYDEIVKSPLPVTPKCFDVVARDSQSRLESLPMDLLVKIFCHLHHDQLKAVFHVSRRISAAVKFAKQWYFNYTTPDRSRQEMLSARTPRLSERWPFPSNIEGNHLFASNPRTPKAPKHGPRPPRPHRIDLKQISAVLFQDSVHTTRMASCLPRPAYKLQPSTRVLFYEEEELCQAVAQNKLL